MLAAALGLIVAGLLLGLFLGYFGFIVAVAGIVLLVVWLVGLRRAGPASPAPPA
jgi:hypothetical protein